MIRLLDLSVVAAFILGGYFGIPQMIWATDIHYIATTLALVGLGAFLSISKDFKLLYLLSDIAPAMGLVGTVAGLSTALPLFLSAPEQAMAAAGSAFYCTAIGIVTFILLYVKGWLIERRG